MGKSFAERQYEKNIKNGVTFKILPKKTNKKTIKKIVAVKKKDDDGGLIEEMAQKMSK